MLAVLYVGLRVDFVTTSYGQAVVAKLVAVSAIVVCGGLNWRESATAPRQRFLDPELAFGADDCEVRSADLAEQTGRTPGADATRHAV